MEGALGAITPNKLPALTSKNTSNGRHALRNDRLPEPDREGQPEPAARCFHRRRLRLQGLHRCPQQPRQGLQEGQEGEGPQCAQEGRCARCPGLECLRQALQAGAA